MAQPKPGERLEMSCSPATICEIMFVIFGPHDGGFSDVFRPDPRSPVTNAQEVFGEEWVSLQCIHRPVMPCKEKKMLLLSHIACCRDNLTY